MACNTCCHVGLGRPWVHLGFCLFKDKPLKFSHCRCSLFSTPSSFKVVAPPRLVFCIHSYCIVYSSPSTCRARCLKEKVLPKIGLLYGQSVQKWVDFTGTHNYGPVGRRREGRGVALRQQWLSCPGHPLIAPTQNFELVCFQILEFSCRICLPCCGYHLWLTIYSCA